MDLNDSEGQNDTEVSRYFIFIVKTLTIRKYQIFRLLLTLKI